MATIKELKEKISPEEILSRINPDAKISDNGRELRSTCPLCDPNAKNDKSLSINRDTKTFYCHRRYEKGDIITLYCKARNICMKQAIAELKDSKIYAPTKKIATNQVAVMPEEIINSARTLKPNESFPYLDHKKVKPFPGLLISKDGKKLIVQYENINGPSTIQFIEQNGFKHFARGSKPTGIYLPLGSIDDSTKYIYIAEGLSTALTIWDALNEKYTVVSVGPKHNIKLIAQYFLDKYPNIRIMICLDTDVKEQIPAEISSERIVFTAPNFNNILPNGKVASDFNDLISVCNQTPEQVKEQIMNNKFESAKKEQNAAEEVIKTSDKPKLMEISQFNGLDLTPLLKNNSEEDLINGLVNIADGLKTGYKIGDIDLEFPGGAISIVAAPTSHGKTTALINFVLGSLHKNSNKDIYFFSYEESQEAILLSFIKTYYHKMLPSENASALSKNSDASIESYFRGNKQYIKKELLYEFERLKNKFFNELITSGSLRIIGSNYTVEDLITAIKYIKENSPNISAIFIDYMQLLKTKNNKISRHEELKNICLMLKDCAIETGLPIILAAQFNRSVKSEQDMSPVNIGEAGDIERIASLIIGIYNRQFVNMSSAKNIDRDGNDVPKQSNLYIEILKGRKIGIGHTSILPFDGNKGVIGNKEMKQSPKELPSNKKNNTNPRLRSEDAIKNNTL